MVCKLRFFAVLVVLSCFAAPLFAQSNVLRVPADSPDLQTAIDTVSDGGIIEITSGTYNAPNDGFLIRDEGKSFTIRSDGGQVTLTGNNTQQVLRYINFDPRGEQSVVFEGIIFADGETTTNGKAGGVTVDNAEATFIDCEFRGNTSNASTTGGGAIFLTNASVGHFFDSRFVDNSARNEGAALRVGTDSLAYVHNSEFYNNRVNFSGHRPSSAGGAIHVTNATLRVSNSRFEGNQAGCVGGAIYAIGNWQQPYAVPTAEVWVSNSTFVDNLVLSHPSVTCQFTEVGGAVHLEDQVYGRFYHSRFDTNTAAIGGGVSMYRSRAEVIDSVFRGNLADGAAPSAGFGGAMMINSNDTNDASTNQGAENRPSAELTIRGSLFQGRYGAVGATANKGGCLFVRGDVNRLDGTGGVSAGGGTANRAALEIDETIFYDCDSLVDSGASGTGVGGAMQLVLVDMTLTDSMILGCDGLGTGSNGGGLRLTVDSDAAITRTTFAGNTAENRAAAILVTGSEIRVDESRFLDNIVTSGNNGSAMWSNQDLPRGIDTSGWVRNSVFNNNSGIVIHERDFNDGPINSVVYNQNTFYPSTGDVYRNELVGSFTASEVNSLVVTRSAAPNTDKSTLGNTSAGSEPVLGTVLAAPAEILWTTAAGDPASSTEAWVAYAWCGSSATFGGSTVAGGYGVQNVGSGGHTLAVGGSSYTANVTTGTTPAASLNVDGTDLQWTTDAGAFLDMSIDRSVSVPSPSANGTIAIASTVDTTYQLYVMTEEGGARASATFDPDGPGWTVFFTGDFETGDLSGW